MNQERLNKIKLRLTPKQAVLFCLKERHCLGSMPDYLNHLATIPLETWPEKKIKEELRRSVYNGTKGNFKEAEEAASQAQSEASFFGNLCLRADQMVTTEVEGYELLIWLLEGEIQGLIFMNGSPLSDGSSPLEITKI